MKPFLIVNCVFILLLFSCNKDDSQPEQQDEFETFTSSICDNVIGPKALYWDYAHSLPVPLTEIPSITEFGSQYINSQYPGLGLQLPPNYTATDVIVPQTQTIGVNVLREDRNVLWRYLPTSTFQGQVDVNAIIGFEIDTMTDILEFNGTPDVLCTTTQQSIVGGFFEGTFGARLIEFGNFTALIWVNNLYDSSLGLTFSSISVSLAPTAEYDAIVFDVFLPFSFQLLIIKDEIRDSDADGFPDDQDNFPFDPNRH